jgi:hypothetical protein
MTNKPKSVANPNKTGRPGHPTDYTPALVGKICNLIANGRSLRKICLADDMPARQTVFNWLTRYKEFREAYAIAVEQRADVLFEQCLEIADDTGGDFITQQDGTTRVDHENIHRSRLRVDTRKWMAGKLAPKKYGDKVLNEHSGVGGGAIKVEDVTPEQRARALLVLMAKTGGMLPT